MAAVEREVTFERGSNARFIAFPGTDDRNEVSRVEDTDPVEIEGGYDKISGQLANVCGRDDRLGFRLGWQLWGLFFTHGDEDFTLEDTFGGE
jgi:hypothetical protein